MMQLRIPVSTRERLTARVAQLRAAAVKAKLPVSHIRLITAQNLVRLAMLTGTPLVVRQSLKDVVRSLRRLGVPRGRPPGTLTRLGLIDASDLEDLKASGG
jgi:hypothetical protein